MEKTEFEQVRDRLGRPSSIVIITHRNPDGDAIGSSIALKLFLDKFNHVVKVILPSEYPDIFEFVPGIQEVTIYDQNREAALSLIAGAEIIFCLDFNGLDRIDTLGPAVDESRAFKAVIDHHLDPEPFADFYISDTTASSTCELVYRFISDMKEKKRMDLDIATCLFIGLITDTGSFTYGTNPNVFRVAADLKEMGVDDFDLHDKIFNSWSERQLKLLGHSLRNRLKTYPDLSAGVIYLNKSDYLKYQISRGDTEGLVNYILMVKGMKVAAFFREMPNGEIRLSLRSKGDISVQELARHHFSGGGHKNASGGSATTDLPSAIQKFLEVLPNYL